MPRCRIESLLVWTTAMTLVCSLNPAATGQTVWSGLSVPFTKAAFVDPTLSENQDRITDNVWLTRGTNQGLFNAKLESGYVNASPADTEWATDLIPENAGKNISAVNWADLSFEPWVDAYGGIGSQMLPSRLMGRDAVVHLISENIYLDLRFSAWSGGGGSFSYERATGMNEPPATTGDYNQNDIVDAADYVVWRDTLSQAVSPPGAGADGDSSGTVDAGDYDFWRARFGNLVEGGAGAANAVAASVPEPTSAVLLVAGLIVVGASPGNLLARRQTWHGDRI